MIDHAVLSPSSAKRWINCPPSALINAQAGDHETVYTREGTLAHAVAELKARKHFLTGIGPKRYEAQMAKFRADELWQNEMDEYTDDYLDALKDASAEYSSPPYVALEQRVDFSEYVPKGFGTADCIMIGGSTLQVVDFKYGKGVEVLAEDNPQMMLYALGALRVYDPIYDIDAVKMTIVQPRIKREPEHWTIYADDLLAWAEEVVRPAAALAAAGEGEFKEGEWCRFCSIKGSCRARSEANLRVAQMDFKMPPELTPEEVAKALQLGQRLSTWLKDIEDYALRSCLNGQEIPGYKAVAGRSTRVWTDQAAAFKAALKSGIPEAMLYERKPVTLAALEKIIGKKQFGATLIKYVTSTPGKPSLVPENDRRQAITNRPTAAEDFKED